MDKPYFISLHSHVFLFFLLFFSSCQLSQIALKLSSSTKALASPIPIILIHKLSLIHQPPHRCHWSSCTIVEAHAPSPTRFIILYIYIYIYRERERERESLLSFPNHFLRSSKKHQRVLNHQVDSSEFTPLFSLSFKFRYSISRSPIIWFVILDLLYAIFNFTIWVLGFCFYSWISSQIWYI